MNKVLGMSANIAHAIGNPRNFWVGPPIGYGFILSGQRSYRVPLRVTRTQP